MQLNEMRVQYDRPELRKDDLHPDACEQFAIWMREALDAGILEPNAMSLATVSASGQPTQRMVLLKSFDEAGFVFYTNLESRKARQIAENKYVSLLFPWLALQRQIAITGKAERLSTTEALAYFVTRPFGSQIGAWASPQSQVVSTRAILEAKWEEAKRKFQEGRVPMPSFWGGYRVAPREIEFWQGRGHRLHDRFLYSKSANGLWKLERLAP